MQLPSGTLLQGGKYKIIKTLGQGGFGITYLAEQVLLQREVALKEFFMKDCCERDATSQVTVGTGSQRVLVEKFRGKFLREAQMMAGMDHPNIVRVLDVFEENGTAYYVMENLPGGSLKDKGPMPEALAEKYIHQVADALAYIHSRNTVHLDIKPSNILLNSRGEAVLIDFGISKHYDTTGEQTSSTPVGQSKGYAPIEQGRDGDVSQFKPSTDIYALGATLYNLVSGLTPPEASVVLEDGLPRPEGVSDRLWQVIEQAMRPVRKDRPQSVAAFLALLSDAAPKVPVQEEAPASMVEKTPDEDQTLIQVETVNHIEQIVAVDLGLPSGVKWASRNLGAFKPEDVGAYFSWGELQPKTVFTWENYRFRKEGVTFENVVFSRYNEDDLKRLAPEDDPAHHLLGGGWSLPTETDIKELLHFCQWIWVEERSIKGYKVISPNQNAIFLPVTGFNNAIDNYGRYWTASLNTPKYARSLIFNKSSIEIFEYSRYIGLAIRPVLR